MRIEKRKVGSSKELAGLVKEALEGELKGLQVIDEMAVASSEAEVGILAGDAAGRIFVIVAKEKSGDGLILSFGRHIAWLKHNKERLARDYPKFDWSGEPGVILMAESFSPEALAIASLLATSPKAAYTMKCLGIGVEKGLYIEPGQIPQLSVKAGAAAVEVPATDLLSQTVKDLVAISDGLEISASFGYRSRALDWVPVANLRSHKGTIWIESGPGKWTTKRIEDDKSLGSVLDVVKKSYDEIVRTKGAAKDAGEDELSDAERKSLHWE